VTQQGENVDRFLVKMVGVIFKGLCQVVIDATVRAEMAEQRLADLQRQQAERDRDDDRLRQAVAASQTAPAPAGGEGG
jgi:hypothetical protein